MTLFELGRRVNFTLPRITLRPRKDEIRTAALALGISQRLAWQAWDTYTWGSAA